MDRYRGKLRHALAITASILVVTGCTNAAPVVYLSNSTATSTTAASGTGSDSQVSSSTATSTTAASGTGSDSQVSPSPAAGCPLATHGAQWAQATSGIVYFDRNQNGQQDPGEPGLPGVPIYLAGGHGFISPAGEISHSTCTDRDGRFSLTLPNGRTQYLVAVRTGWFRTQCPGLNCAVGGPGDNVEVKTEWIRSRQIVTGQKGGVFKVGLIPDAGQYVQDVRTKVYFGYPPDLSKAHKVDIAVRFTDDVGPGCDTITHSGVNCIIGGTISQSMYIANSGMSPVSGVHAVMQLPYGEVHHDLRLLKSGSSPGVTSISNISITPAISAPVRGHRPTLANYTTINFTVDGTIPPAGFVSVVSTGILVAGAAHTQIVGSAGITAEAGSAADTDSGFCPTPAVPVSTCKWLSVTHSLLDPHADDTDTNRWNILN